MLLYLKFALLVSILLASRINLISAKQFHFKMCWTRGQFGDILDRNCPSLYGLKRSIETKDVVKSEKEAKSFVRTLMRGQTVNPETQNTDYHEECCIEGCKVEEIAEYCKLL